MATTNNVDIVIDEKIRSYAKIYSSLLKDEYQRNNLKIIRTHLNKFAEGGRNAVATEMIIDRLKALV